MVGMTFIYILILLITSNDCILEFLVEESKENLKEEQNNSMV